jgi:hypothetical protein
MYSSAFAVISKAPEGLWLLLSFLRQLAFGKCPETLGAGFDAGRQTGLLREFGSKSRPLEIGILP